MKSELQKIIKQWTSDQSSDQKIITLFEKVRDIPYGNIGSRNPLDVYKHNKGTCSGKHELLKALYKELGISVKDFIIMHRFKHLPVEFPKEIQTMLDKTDIIDPHNFFKIKRDEKWLTIDITWDKALKKLGFPVNLNWNGRSEMQVAVAPGGKVYETSDPIALKKELISKFPEQAQKERKLFLEKCTKWLDSLRKEGEI